MSDPLEELASAASSRGTTARNASRAPSMLAYSPDADPGKKRAHWWACFQAGFFGGLGFFAAGVGIWVIVAVTFCGLAAVLSGVSGGSARTPTPPGLPYPFSGR